MSGLAETLSATHAIEHVHASGTAGRGPTATEGCPPELAAAIFKAICCHMRRGDGISNDALKTGTGPHVDETNVDASWVTWESTNDHDGKPEFRDVYKGVTVDLHRSWYRKKGRTSVC